MNLKNYHKKPQPFKTKPKYCLSNSGRGITLFLKVSPFLSSTKTSIQANRMWEWLLRLTQCRLIIWGIGLQWILYPEHSWIFPPSWGGISPWIQKERTLNKYMHASAQYFIQYTFGKLGQRREGKIVIHYQGLKEAGFTSSEIQLVISFSHQFAMNHHC